MIESKDIFFNYEKARSEIIDLVILDRDELVILVKNLAKYLYENRPKYGDNEIKNIYNFVMLLPFKIYMIFIDEIEKISGINNNYFKDMNFDEGYKYVGEIHKIMFNKFKNYKEMITNFIKPAYKKRQERLLNHFYIKIDLFLKEWYISER